MPLFCSVLHTHIPDDDYIIRYMYYNHHSHMFVCVYISTNDKPHTQQHSHVKSWKIKRGKEEESHGRKPGSNVHVMSCINPCWMRAPSGPSKVGFPPLGVYKYYNEGGSCDDEQQQQSVLRIPAKIVVCVGKRAEIWSHFENGRKWKIAWSL